MIDNPEYKGEWKAKKIPNPDYKGSWVHPQIDNPEFVDEKAPTKYASMDYVGFDLWQVKSGDIFDNIIVTDSIEEAEAFAKDTYFKNKDAEKAMFDKAEEATKAEEAAAAKAKEDASKAAEDKEAKDDEDDEEDDDKDEDSI
jgi:calreticulin